MHERERSGCERVPHRDCFFSPLFTHHVSFSRLSSFLFFLCVARKSLAVVTVAVEPLRSVMLTRIVLSSPRHHSLFSRAFANFSRTRVIVSPILLRDHACMHALQGVRAWPCPTLMLVFMSICCCELSLLHRRLLSVFCCNRCRGVLHALKR